MSPNSLHHCVLTDSIICSDNPLCILFLSYHLMLCKITKLCFLCFSVVFFQNAKYSIVLYSWFDGFSLESDKMHLLERASNYTESCNVSLEPLYSTLLKEQLTLKNILFTTHFVSVFLNIYLTLFFITRNICMKIGSLFFRGPSATTA